MEKYGNRRSKQDEKKKELFFLDSIVQKKTGYGRQRYENKKGDGKVKAIKWDENTKGTQEKGSY
mgnify:CR=1 FL=1